VQTGGPVSGAFSAAVAAVAVVAALPGADDGAAAADGAPLGEAKLPGFSDVTLGSDDEQPARSAAAKVEVRSFFMGARILTQEAWRTLSRCGLESSRVLPEVRPRARGQGPRAGGASKKLNDYRGLP
jgi:formylglycine-generating enzyme required for sulfatase activity